MYAVIEQGSKQYKVVEGERIIIELADVADDAATIEINKVLFASDGKDFTIGTPYIEGAKVIGKFSGTAAKSVIQDKKLFTTYFRRRKNSKKRIGHRQKRMEIVIDKITV